MANLNLLEEIILQSVSPWHLEQTYLTPSNIVIAIECEFDAAEQALKELEELELVSPGRQLAHVRETGYKTKWALGLERERILHRKKWRHSALLNQTHNKLSDLIIAIGKFPDIANSRLTGPFIGYGPNIAVSLLKLFLFQISAEEIDIALDELEKKDLIARTQEDHNGEKKPAFKLLPKVNFLYKREVMSRLKLKERECILDENKKNNIEIFFAWQSDFNPSRTKISNALESVIETANVHWNLARPLKLVWAVDVGDGAVRIDQQLIDRISGSELFVGDITICAKSGGKAYPNPNVLIECGYALESKRPHQVLLVQQLRPVEEIPGEGIFASFPFDITVVSRIEFEKPAELKERLDLCIRSALDKMGLLLANPKDQ